MHKALLTCVIVAGAHLAAAGSHAQTAITECTKGFDAATITAKVTVSTDLDGCPVLENKELRELIDEHMTGSVFAFPAVPQTCLSGVITEGTVVTKNKTISVVGSTESAQRFFPEAASVYPSGGGIFMVGATQDGIPFASGAAATVVTLEGVSKKFDLQLVLSDRFTLNLGTFPIVDTEDLEVVGSKKGKATGRLTGIALVEQFPPGAIQDAQFDVQGQICIK